MAWTIKYSDSARKQLHKLDRQSAIRILDYMDERILASSNPRAQGKKLTGPTFVSYWRYRVSSYRMICQIQDEVLCVLVEFDWQKDSASVDETDRLLFAQRKAAQFDGKVLNPVLLEMLA